MSISAIIILILILAAAGFIIYRRFAAGKAKAQLSKMKFERVRTLYGKLESGENVTAAEVYDYAKDLKSRQVTFQLLTKYNLIHLFPDEFNTIEQAAASSLANWLEFPTELDACPDEMQYIKRVTIDYDGNSNFVHYEVFKYRVDEPHWAADKGWILGVVGPYFDDSNPYDLAQSTFSRCNSTVANTTPDEEAIWVHENISKRR